MWKLNLVKIWSATLHVFTVISIEAHYCHYYYDMIIMITIMIIIVGAADWDMVWYFGASFQYRTSPIRSGVGVAAITMTILLLARRALDALSGTSYQLKDIFCSA